MIQLYLPESWKGVARRSFSVPERFRYADIPYQKCVHKDWGTGAFLMLWKTGEAVDLCLNHFLLQKEVVFDARCTRDVFVFHFMQEGHARLQLPGDQPAIRLRPGMFNLFMIPEGSCCPVEIGRGRHKSCHVFLRPEDVQLMGSDLAPVAELVEVYQRGIPHIRPARVCTPVSPAILQLLQELEHCDGPEAVCYNRVYLGVLQIFIEYRKELTRALHAMSRAQDDEAQVRMVHAHILSHYTEGGAVQLHVLAALAGMSASRLERLFRQAYGMTVHDLVTQQRIRMACTLLATTRKTVSDIGYTVGYSSPVSFHRAFVRVCGCTPGEYRMEG
jgi:AraC-like DNA-binding protein